MLENSRYIENNMCAYYEGKLTDYSNKACSDEINIKGSYPFIYDIEFKNL